MEMMRLAIDPSVHPTPSTRSATTPAPPVPLPMLQLAKLLLLLALSAALLRAETPQGHFHLTNTPYVFHASADGELTFLNTGQSGQLAIAADHTFAGKFGDTPISGKFADGKLWLRRSAERTPAPLEYLECRPVDKPTAQEILRYSRAPRSDLSTDLPHALRTSLANAIRRRLELLAESVMFHCLEYGLSKAERLADLVGPEKQLSAFPSIDGEDYNALDLTPNTTWTIESTGGVRVTLEQ